MKNIIARLMDRMRSSRRRKSPRRVTEVNLVPWEDTTAQTDPVRRYDLFVGSEGDGGGDLRQTRSGDWVRIEDHLAAVGAARQSELGEIAEFARMRSAAAR